MFSGAAFAAGNSATHPDNWSARLSKNQFPERGRPGMVPQYAWTEPPDRGTGRQGSAAGNPGGKLL